MHTTLGGIEGVSQFKKESQMGWDYEHIQVYGLIVQSRGCPKIKEILKKYDDVISWRDKGVPRTLKAGEKAVFVYVKSTEKQLLHISGSQGLDTEGTAFDPPKHPLFLQIEGTLPSPRLSEREQEALSELEQECTILLSSKIEDAVREKGREQQRKTEHQDRLGSREPDLSSLSRRIWVTWGRASYDTKTGLGTGTGAGTEAVIEAGNITPTSTPLKVYVAGGWKFRARIQGIKERLEADPRIEVISGWIERENGINTPEDSAYCAKCDIDEVTESDVVLAIMEDPKYAYRGTFTELGCAFGQNKPVVILCPGTVDRVSKTETQYSHYCQTNVFYHHSLADHVQTEEEAKLVLLEWHGTLSEAKLVLLEIENENKNKN